MRASDATLVGVDFTSAPRTGKPILIASGRLEGATLAIDTLEAACDFPAFEAFLRRPGPWVGAFDFPFGLPRELLEGLGWPHAPCDGEGAWPRLMRHLEAMPRADMVAAFRGWCAARPVGAKFAHRAVDRLAGSSPSMKWVNPPVAFMLQAGAPRLLHAGVTVPGMHAGDPMRVALEGYPGVLARQVVGRASYKSDTRAHWTAARTAARAAILDALARGVLLGVRVVLDAASRQACIDDARGDRLDAVLCVVQAAWSALRADDGFGLPREVDPVEGWIAGV